MSVDTLLIVYVLCFTFICLNNECMYVRLRCIGSQCVWHYVAVLTASIKVRMPPYCDWSCTGCKPVRSSSSSRQQAGAGNSKDTKIWLLNSFIGIPLCRRRESLRAPLLPAATISAAAAAAAALRPRQLLLNILPVHH